MKNIRNKIKIVFWDLDDTIWNGTLAENDDVKLRNDVVEIIKKLNSRGIVSSICSKNDFENAKKKMIEFNIWNLFIFPNISFSSKSEMIKSSLDQMHLRAANACLVDDNSFNLREIEYSIPEMSVIDEEECLSILSIPEFKGKNDEKLERFNQYKQLEKKTSVKRSYSSNEAFLESCNIEVQLIDYSEQYFERLSELVERTNQLNFTKNRMSNEQLQEMLHDEMIETKLVKVIDNFGDYGLIGFYSIKDNILIHFVFSCRIMNMGIEQWVYAKLKFPKINVVGEIASQLNDYEVPIWIKEYSDSDIESMPDIYDIIDEKTEVNIFALGACDLYNPIAYFDMPNQKFIYECNVFKGEERGVNVGTEYIRSIFEMSDIEKAYCRNHFLNYTGSLAFNSQIFSNKYDYVIMSFHDDMIFKIYEKKDNNNIRVLLSPNPDCGVTSVVVDGKKLSREEEERWLDNNYNKGHYISEERFRENIIYIMDHLDKNTKFVLINGPEMNFFRLRKPEYPEVLEQIKKINSVLKSLEKEYPDKIALVDINTCIRSRDDVTDYVFHLKANTAYNLFVQIVWTIVRKLPSTKLPMLSKVRKNRQIIIFGNDIRARNTFYNLKIGKENAIKYVHFDYENKIVGQMKVENCDILKNNSDRFYVVIADKNNLNKICSILEGYGYNCVDDYIYMNNLNQYKKVWNENK